MKIPNNSESRIALSQLYAEHGLELIDWIASKLLIDAGTHELNNNELLAASLKASGKRLQAEYHNLNAVFLINDHITR